jgi:hypothetical protein
MDRLHTLSWVLVLNRVVYYSLVMHTYHKGGAYDLRPLPTKG